MKIQYRILYSNGQSFAHVRVKRFMFWSKWRKIGKHISGYGLYDVSDYNHPLTYTKAENLIEGYHLWIQKEKTRSFNYIEYSPENN